MGDESDRIRYGLLWPGADRDTRIDLLRELLELDDRTYVRETLVSAARQDHNRDVLDYILRSYGYLEDPDAIEDIVCWLQAGEVSIVVNTIKSIAALDPARAVLEARKIFHEGKSKLAYPVAEVLVDRCADHVEDLFLSMAFSRRSKHRALAVYYLRTLQPEEAVPLTIEMIRRERKRGVREILVKLLSQRSGEAHLPALEKFQRELLSKIGELEGLLHLLDGKVPDEVDDLSTSIEELVISPLSEQGESPLSEQGEEGPGLVSARLDLQAHDE